jgi:hypothetical protein
MKETDLFGLTRFLVPAVIIIIGLVLSLLFTPFTAWSLLTAAMVAMMLVPRPQVIVICYIYWSLLGRIFVDPTLYVGFRIPMVRFVDEFLAVGMTVCLLGQITLVKRMRKALNTYLACLTVLLVFMAISVQVNGVPRVPAFKFTTAYLGFVPAFLLMLDYTPRMSGRRFIAFLTLVLFVQLALNIGWKFGFNPILNVDQGGPDFAHGTLGGCNYVAYFCVFFILLCVSRLLERESVPGFSRPWTFVLMTLCFVQLVYTFTTHAILLLVLMIFLMLVMGLRFGYMPVNVAFVFIAVFLFVGLLTFLIIQVSDVGRFLNVTLSPKTLMERLESMKHGSLATVYRNVFFDVWDELPAPILGGGPGNFSSAVAIEYGAPLTKKYIWFYYMSASGQQMIRGSSVTQSLISGISAMWGDLGPAGAPLFFALYVIPARRVWRHMNNNAYIDPHQRVLSRAYITFMVMCLLITLLQDNFWSDLLQCSVFAMSAYLWDPILPEKPNLIPESAPTWVRRRQLGRSIDVTGALGRRRPSGRRAGPIQRPV